MLPFLSARRFVSKLHGQDHLLISHKKTCSSPKGGSHQLSDALVPTERIVTVRKAASSLRLPFGETAILMTPERIAPAMALPRHFDHMRLINLDTRAGTLRYFDKPVLVMEDILVGDVVQKVAALIVVNAKALLWINAL